MKKILAVSLVAMMAVSTARADIASTAYVTGAVNAEKALRDSADTAIKDSIGTVSAANMGTTATTVVAAIKEHSDELATMASSDTVESLQDSLSSLTTTVNGKQATLTTSNVTTTGNGNVVTAVTAADGKVTVTKGTSLGSLATKSAIATGDITDGTITNADISSSAAIDQGKISGLTSALSGKQASLTTAQLDAANSGITLAKVSTYDGYASQISAKEALANKLETEEEVTIDETNQDTLYPTIGRVMKEINTTVTEVNNDVSALSSGLSSLTTTVNGKQATLTTAQLNAANSGITSAKVSTYDTAATNASAAKGVTDLISAGTTGSDGTYVLTATVSNNTVTGYKWELIDRSY